MTGNYGGLSDKQRAAMNRIKAEMEQRFGPDVAREETAPIYPLLSSGIPQLDELLGGGYQGGRITEIYGDDCAGKTTVALMALSDCNARGELGVYIDTDCCYSQQQLDMLGISTSDFPMLCPPDGEGAVTMAEEAIRTHFAQVVVIDSAASMTPRHELKSRVGESESAGLARLVNLACHKLLAAAEKTGAVVIFTNQLREKPGGAYESTEVTTGGKALSCFAATRLRVVRSESRIERGLRIQAQVIKSRTCAAGAFADLDVVFRGGA